MSSSSSSRPKASNLKIKKEPKITSNKSSNGEFGNNFSYSEVIKNIKIESQDQIVEETMIKDEIINPNEINLIKIEKEEVFDPNMNASQQSESDDDDDKLVIREEEAFTEHSMFNVIVKEEEELIIEDIYEPAPKKRKLSDMQSTSSENETISASEFQCKICQRNFKRRIDLVHHMKMHSETRYECEKCGQKFKFKGYFLKHKCIICDICDRPFFLKQQLRDHKRLAHSDTEKTQLFECDICGKDFKYRHGIYYHITTFHMPFLEDIFECEHCPKKFKLKETYRLHLKHHMSLIECSLCGKKLRNVNLGHHMRHVHTTERNFSCSQCKMSFKTKECLKSHIRTHEKKFECPKCNKKFANKPFLVEHLNWHENPDEFTCKLCKKTFAQKYCLKAHIKLHDNGHNFEKLTCTKCSYGTDSKENFEKHMQKHLRQEENEKLKQGWLQCEQCPMKLKNKIKLATHYWKKHNQMMPK